MFQKAKPIASPLKLSAYGPHGSGKSLTSLLFAEGLAKWRGKRIAYIDTEFSTRAYRQAVPERTVHPEAFDFDVLDTRSMAEALAAVRSIDHNVHGVVVLDSITRLWDAAREAWMAKNPGKDDIPLNAWNAIKRPYKELIQLLMQGAFDVIITGRQRAVFEDDDGKMRNVGVAMRAEGETQYEPDVCLRFDLLGKRGEDGTVCCFAEKDRYGILSGRTFPKPSFKTIEPLIPFLGDTAPATQSDEDAAEMDGELLQSGADKAAKKLDKSRGIHAEYLAKLLGCGSLEELGALAAEMKKVKRYLVEEHTNALRVLYEETRSRLANAATPEEL